MEQHSRTEHVNQRQLSSADRTTTYALREHKQDHRRSICKPQWSRDHYENKRDLLRCCREWNNQCLTNNWIEIVNNQRRTSSTISSRQTKNEWSKETRRIHTCSLLFLLTSIVDQQEQLVDHQAPECGSEWASSRDEGQTLPRPQEFPPGHLW